ncbi:MAG TPA: HAMP domain-containing sensor histidine kinase [Candidatus Margulisiibacteriota bacterium]|nr:HAMP domain-containing sensor histidine kinase [Candidatus Margulisiibacteriota bacterium]
MNSAPVGHMSQLAGTSVKRLDDNSMSVAQAVVLLRWVLIIATSYLVVFSRPLGQGPTGPALFVAAYFASNVLLTELLPRFRSHYAFDVCVVLIDTVMVSIGLTLTGTDQSQFYVVFFLVLFLSALTERLGLVVMAAAMMSVAHLYTESQLVGVSCLLNPAYLLRVPFLFVVALFFGNLVQDARGRERQAHAAREQAQRMETLSGVSHDLKNPLGVIQSLATLLLEGDAGALNDRQMDLVRRIHASTRHVITFALNIIDAARIDAGRLVLHRSSVNLSDLVEDALLLTRSAAELKGLTLQCSVEPGMPQATIDVGQMERVISNLVGNAVKFTPAGGKVSVSVRRSGNQMVLSVQDTGLGIAGTDLPTIFEQYRRRNNRSDGSGLGLFIVKAIVEAHGGSVSIDSTAGRGTTVSVQLPFAPHEPGHQPANGLRLSPKHWWQSARASTESSVSVTAHPTLPRS